MLFIARIWMIVVILLLLFFFTSEGRAGGTKPAKASKSSSEQLARGRYLLFIGGCNDCHTPGFMETGGKLPESEWLTGAAMGFMGPWGVTYPVNLRNMVARMTESEWTNYVQTYQAAPPMPWWSLHAMPQNDVKAIYAYIKSLGPKGEEAPANLPPGTMPTTPYIEFVPKFPGK